MTHPWSPVLHVVGDGFDAAATAMADEAAATDVAAVAVATATKGATAADVAVVPPPLLE